MAYATIRAQDYYNGEKDYNIKLIDFNQIIFPFAEQTLLLDKKSNLLNTHSLERGNWYLVEFPNFKLEHKDNNNKTK